MGKPTWKNGQTKCRMLVICVFCPKILMGNARILTRVMATYCAILGETNSCASLTYQGYYFGRVFFSLEMLGVILCSYIYVAIATFLCCTRCDAQKEPSRRSQISRSVTRRWASSWSRWSLTFARLAWKYNDPHLWFVNSVNCYIKSLTSIQSLDFLARSTTLHRFLWVTEFGLTGKSPFSSMWVAF